MQKTRKSPLPQLETAKKSSHSTENLKKWKKIDFFQKMYLVSRIVPKTLRRGPFRVFNIHSAANCQKIKGGLFGDFKKFSKKSRNYI